MKKLFIVISALFLVVLVGCGKKDNVEFVEETYYLLGSDVYEYNENYWVRLQKNGEFVYWFGKSGEYKRYYRIIGDIIFLYTIETRIEQIKGEQVHIKYESIFDVWSYNEDTLMDDNRSIGGGIVIYMTNPMAKKYFSLENS